MGPRETLQMLPQNCIITLHYLNPQPKSKVWEAPGSWQLAAGQSAPGGQPVNGRSQTSERDLCLSLAPAGHLTQREVWGRDD